MFTNEQRYIGGWDLGQQFCRQEAQMFGKSASNYKGALATIIDQVTHNKIMGTLKAGFRLTGDSISDLGVGDGAQRFLTDDTFKNGIWIGMTRLEVRDFDFPYVFKAAWDNGDTSNDEWYREVLNTPALVKNSGKFARFADEMPNCCKCIMCWPSSAGVDQRKVENYYIKRSRTWDDYHCSEQARGFVCMMDAVTEEDPYDDEL